MNDFGAFELQKLATYCYLIPTDLINPYAVTTVKRILLFKVTELEHEQQNESNVLSVMKRLSSSSLRQPNVLFSNF